MKYPAGVGGVEVLVYRGELGLPMGDGVLRRVDRAGVACRRALCGEELGLCDESKIGVVPRVEGGVIERPAEANERGLGAVLGRWRIADSPTGAEG